MTDRRVAILTGAARGLGAATAVHLAKSGWDLVLTDVCAGIAGIPYPLADAADLDKVVLQCRALGSSCVGLAADVRDQAALATAVEEATRRFGRLDGAVANAGIVLGGAPAWSLDLQHWHLQMEINAGGVMRLAQAAVPAMLAAAEPRSGRFVAVCSVAGAGGLRQLAAYVASKHAVAGYVRSLALDLAGTGLTANSVGPGTMRTEIALASARLYGADSAEALAIHQPGGALIEPVDVAAVIGFLLSPASATINGALLPADMGMLAAAAY
jgi:SDR family mycofactocin-dependent oxidoreductase